MKHLHTLLPSIFYSNHRAVIDIDTCLNLTLLNLVFTLMCINPLSSLPSWLCSFVRCSDLSKNLLFRQDRYNYYWCWSLPAKMFFFLNDMFVRHYKQTFTCGNFFSSACDGPPCTFIQSLCPWNPCAVAWVVRKTAYHHVISAGSFRGPFCRFSNNWSFTMPS